MSNPDPKQDARMSKAKRAMINAMLTLLQRRSFQKINVNDICETALVSRATFYVHFEDKYHLLRVTLDDIKRRITGGAETTERGELIRLLVEFIYDNPEVFRNLVMEETNPELSELLSRMFGQGITEELNRLEADGAAFAAPVSVLSVYLAGGISNLLLWWISGGFSVSKHDMIAWLTELSGAYFRDGCGLALPLRIENRRELL